VLTASVADLAGQLAARYGVARVNHIAPGTRGPVHRGAVVVLELGRDLDEGTLNAFAELLTDAPSAIVTAARSAVTPGELRAALEAAGVAVDAVGTSEALAVAVVPRLGSPMPAPATFRALAVVPVYNEADIIEGTVRYLLDQGLDVHVIDNWSDDGTAEILAGLANQGLATVERYPDDGPAYGYDWTGLLSAIERCTADRRADWFVYQDADERRSAPWPGITLRDALWTVQRRGFNAVGHAVVEFHPVDDSFEPGVDLESSFSYYSPTRIGADSVQITSWQATSAPVDLCSLAGHEALFPNRRLFPYQFLLKHYPIRSQRHGEQKVLRDRRPRYLDAERRRGWHTHYDHMRRGHNFLKRPEDLTRFDASFYDRRIVQRLTGIGLAGGGQPAQGWRRLASRSLDAVGLLGVSRALRRRYRIIRRREVATGRR
jgi:glycosyltransferase involved in cell wall biosynthesis